MSHSYRAETANVLWFIPTHGDGRYLGTTHGARDVSLDYMTQVAKAADACGYFGVLLPTGRSCEDSWIVAASLVSQTKRLRFLVAVRPGLQSPTVAARMTATLDRLSGGRLLVNVVTGGDPLENAGDGIFLDHGERYALTDEFLTIYRDVLSGDTVDFVGRHLKVEGAKLLYPPVQTPHPPLYFGGSSGAGQKVAAKHIQKYLTWGEPPQQVKAKIDEMRREAEAAGRTISFGIRLHAIVRETRQEAWDAAERLIRYVDEQTIAEAQRVFARMDSVGQNRMAALHRGDRSKLEVSPDLWAGVGLVRGGAGTALVGDAETVAKRMREYMDVGIDTFIMSGYPHLEESYRFAELVLPLLPLDAGTRAPSVGRTHRGPFGEMIGNTHVPLERRVSAS